MRKHASAISPFNVLGLSIVKTIEPAPDALSMEEAVKLLQLQQSQEGFVCAAGENGFPRRPKRRIKPAIIIVLTIALDLALTIVQVHAEQVGKASLKGLHV